MFKPTESQATALEALREWSLNETGGPPVFLLTGQAGTGKTSVIREFADWLRTSGRAFHLLAPTGRAARVLQDRTKLPARTIHSHIFSRPTYTESQTIETVTKGIAPGEDPSADGATETFVASFPLKHNDDPINTLYIVDEASMVGDHEHSSDSEFLRFGSGRLLHDILTYALDGGSSCDRKVIFVGDSAQLPPVGSKLSPALTPSHLLENHQVTVREAELTDVVRQAKTSGVLANARSLNSCLRSGSFNDFAFDFSTEDVIESEIASVKDKLRRSHKKHGTDQVILITRTNKDALDWNRAYRGQTSSECKPVSSGDRVVIVRNNHRHEVLNGDFATVEQVDEGTERRTIRLKRKHAGATEVVLSFRKAVLRLTTGPDQPVECLLIDELFDSPEAGLSPLQQQALYVDFIRRHSQLAAGSAEFSLALAEDRYFNAVQAKFGYAVTCHKAQGGEWKVVYVSFPKKAHLRNRDGFRWMYTAVTRAKRWMIAINPPELTPFDKITVGGEAPPPDSPEESPQVQIESLIRETLQSNGIDLRSIDPLQFGFRVHVSDGTDNAGFTVHYNKKDEVTSVQPFGNPQNTPQPLTDSADCALRRLIGKPIRLPPTEESTAPEFVLEFAELLREEYRKETSTDGDQPLEIDVRVKMKGDWEFEIKMTSLSEWVQIKGFFKKKQEVSYLKVIDSRGNSLAESVNQMLARIDSID